MYTYFQMYFPTYSLTLDFPGISFSQKKRIAQTTPAENLGVGGGHHPEVFADPRTSMEAAGTPVAPGGSNPPVPVDPTIKEDVKIAEMEDQTLGSTMIQVSLPDEGPMLFYWLVHILAVTSGHSSNMFVVSPESLRQVQTRKKHSSQHQKAPWLSQGFTPSRQTCAKKSFVCILVIFWDFIFVFFRPG